MTVTAVVGAQWGDEGKGRIVDYLAKRANYVIRFQGGDNAGHTVINDFGKTVLHLVPCGIFYPNVHNIIGTGCVVNPQALLQEIANLKSIGVSSDRLWISSRAQMMLPYHRTLDELEEQARGADTIGTTKRGVGPAYSDKATRSGLRMGDLLQPEWLEGRLDSALRTVNRKLTILGGQPVNGREIYDLLMEFRLQLAPRIVDTVPMLRMALEANNDILLEGQLGVMRDLDWGIYPYVTSSHPTAAFAPSGAGLPAGSLNKVYGVCKAYSTCVGDGPFPVELHDEIGKLMQDVGQEFGATTGRPRRCGWFDGVAIRYAAWLKRHDRLGHYQIGRTRRHRNAQNLHRLSHGGRHCAHRHRPRHLPTDGRPASLGGDARLGQAHHRLSQLGRTARQRPQIRQPHFRVGRRSRRLRIRRPRAGQHVWLRRFGSSERTVRTRR